MENSIFNFYPKNLEIIQKMKRPAIFFEHPVYGHFEHPVTVSEENVTRMI